MSGSDSDRVDCPLFTRALVLATLHTSAPLYAAAIARKVSKISGVAVSAGSLYPALERLMDEGLIRRANRRGGLFASYDFYELSLLGKKKVESHRLIVGKVYGIASEAAD